MISKDIEAEIKRLYHAEHQSRHSIAKYLWPDGVPFCPLLLPDENADIQKEKAPAMRLLLLDALCWLLVQTASKICRCGRFGAAFKMSA